MKTSQKGTKLNEVRYFRQSRRYTRKRIPTMRLIPNLPGPLGNLISSPKDRVPQSTRPRSSTRARNRVTVDHDQRSREIAWISYTSDSEESDNFSSVKHDESPSRWRDTFVETEPEREMLVCFPEVADITAPEVADITTPEVAENPRIGKKLEAEKEVQVKLELQVEEKNIGVDESAVESESPIPAKPEDFTVLLPVKPEARVEPQRDVEPDARHEIPQVRPNSKNSSDSERSYWLRYTGIRKILDFFGHLLGKRATETQEEVARTVVDHRLIEKSVDGGSNEARCKRPDSPTRSQTKKSTKRKNIPTRSNKAKKQPEDPPFSDLARQIMNTRDKRLRVALMEHELRARKLEEENRRYRKILEDKLRTRQTSSPLH